MIMKLNIRLTVNGKECRLRVGAHKTLLDILREDMDLTGTKKGCDSGDCGACSVIMNGKLVNACLVLAGEADKGNVLTIEGLKKDMKLHPIQQAFIDHHGFQCGYCTPGMILAAKALLDVNPKPTYDEARAAISGNLCRCTGYNKIIEAIMSVKDYM
jgi:carbon-monoxide dehydrogenase small subunit